MYDRRHIGYLTPQALHGGSVRLGRGSCCLTLTLTTVTSKLRVVVSVKQGYFGVRFSFILGLTASFKYLLVTVLLAQLLEDGGSMARRFADCREYAALEVRLDW